MAASQNSQAFCETRILNWRLQFTLSWIRSCLRANWPIRRWTPGKHVSFFQLQLFDPTSYYWQKKPNMKTTPTQTTRFSTFNYFQTCIPGIKHLKSAELDLYTNKLVQIKISASVSKTLKVCPWMNSIVKKTKITDRCMTCSNENMYFSKTGCVV